jgi:hypothetical protein
MLPHEAMKRRKHIKKLESSQDGLIPRQLVDMIPEASQPWVSQVSIRIQFKI